MFARNWNNCSWEVEIDDKKFLLFEEEFEALANAINTSKRFVIFDDFVLSVNHIGSASRIYHRKELSSPELPNLTPEQIVKNEERIKEIRNKLLVKTL